MIVICQFLIWRQYVFHSVSLSNDVASDQPASIYCYHRDRWVESLQSNLYYAQSVSHLFRGHYRSFTI